MTIKRVLPAIAASLVLAGPLTLCGGMVSSANASTTQLAMFQPGQRLIGDPEGTLDELQGLGVGVVRVILPWASVAPHPSSRNRPAHFNANDPAAYAASNWAPFDAVVKAATARRMTIDLTIGSGAPVWADTPPITAPTAVSPLRAWKPRPNEYQAFVHAVSQRYSGQYTPQGELVPLPRIGFWTIWNEPNFGKNLAPQASSGSTVATSAAWYRKLVDAGWNGLVATGHRHDTILIGSLAARGESAAATRRLKDGRPGVFGTTKPLRFIRSLYCVDARYRPLRGKVAGNIGCPTNTSAGFQRAHPGLFSATGFADHPYPNSLPPNQSDSKDPDFTELSTLPNLASALDRTQRVYGSHRRLPIYVDEYGYITNPPNHSGHFVSPSTAAKYINWAEYLSYKNSRVATTMQFLLEDPNPRVGVPEFGGFASGLEFFKRKHKPSYDAYRMPLFLPTTTAKRGQALEVWGCVRPATGARQLTHESQQVSIQFQRNQSGPFTTLKVVPITNVRGYFDVRLKFPASGSVRLEWTGTQTTGTQTTGTQTTGSQTTETQTFHSRVEHIKLTLGSGVTVV